jgi:hypothetical protein
VTEHTDQPVPLELTEVQKLRLQNAQYAASKKSNCWEKGKVELMLGAREYLWNRAEGRPFMAENPETKAKPPALQDERLQKAISALIPKPATRNVM